VCVGFCVVYYYDLLAVTPAIQCSTFYSDRVVRIRYKVLLVSNAKQL